MTSGKIINDCRRCWGCCITAEPVSEWGRQVTESKLGFKLLSIPSDTSTVLDRILMCPMLIPDLDSLLTTCLIYDNRPLECSSYACPEMKRKEQYLELGP